MFIYPPLNNAKILKLFNLIHSSLFMCKCTILFLFFVIFTRHYFCFTQPTLILIYPYIYHVPCPLFLPMPLTVHPGSFSSVPQNTFKMSFSLFRLIYGTFFEFVCLKYLSLLGTYMQLQIQVLDIDIQRQRQKQRYMYCIRPVIMMRRVF